MLQFKNNGRDNHIRELDVDSTLHRVRVIVLGDKLGQDGVIQQEDITENK